MARHSRNRPYPVVKNWINTDLGQELPDVAEEVWEKGFRPKWAKDVNVGEIIIYFPTMFGFPMSANYETATVTGVKWVEGDGEVLINHSGPESDDFTDELTEVWVKS